jgi:ribonuclease P/MRP protein subunit RPP40
MNFNAKKCHNISISKKKLKPLLDYKLGSNQLSAVVDSFPYLRVTVSADLKWHSYVDNICTKATRTYNFIRRNIYHCSPDAKALAYISLVRPHLEYAASSWDPYTARDTTQLEKVQRRAA